jgi:regulator of sigma E protease
MSVILLIIIISVLVFVHELGHFSVAKFFGIRVDEFGMGFPPRAKKLFSRKGTDYTLNWIPFGGFVKIYGEDSLENGEKDPEYHRSMVAKPWWQQILVLIAGVVMNVLFAWILFSTTFIVGAPTAVSGVKNPEQVINPQLTVLQVVSQSPAETAGLMVGDKILKVETLDRILVGADLTAVNFTDTIRSTPPFTPVHIEVEQKDATIENFLIIPTAGVNGQYPAIGVSIDQIGMYRQNILHALSDGARTTWHVTQSTFQSFKQLITGKIALNNLTGPVGLVPVIGDAQKIGAVYVVILTAIISINLAVLNIIPFPALDGGRIAIVIIETITRRKILQKIIGVINAAGFLLLIGLMILVTAKDVIKLF